MADITINLLYDELVRMRGDIHKLKEMRKEIHEIKEALIPEESVSEEERRELHATIAEMKKGNEKNWREAIGK